MARIVSLLVPALEHHCKLLNVWPQDRLLNSDVVKLYLALFSSLISKPDLFSAHRDPIFCCEHNRSGKHAEGPWNLLHEPRTAAPSWWWERFPNPSHAGWGWEANLGETISLKNGVSFLLSWDFSPCFLFLLAFPLVLSRKEACYFMFILCTPSPTTPSFHGCPLGT